MRFVEKNGDFTDFNHSDQTNIHLVCHVVNSHGIAASGAVVAVRKKFEKAILQYEAWFEGLADQNTFPKCLDTTNKRFELGNIQTVKVDTNVIVANFLAQKGFGAYDMPPGRYEAIDECLRKLKLCCQELIKQGKIPYIHACKFGSKRSGLDWNKIFEMVRVNFGDLEGVWTTYSYEESQ